MRGQRGHRKRRSCKPELIERVCKAKLAQGLTRNNKLKNVERRGKELWV